MFGPRFICENKILSSAIISTVKRTKNRKNVIITELASMRDVAATVGSKS